MKMRPLILSFIILMIAASGYAQTTIKGIVYDKQSEQPLIGANVVLNSLDPVKGTVTDLEGRFDIQAVEPGRHTLQVSYLGYLSITLPSVLVTSGKDVIMEIGLEESTVEMDEVVVTAEVEKDKSNNEMATVSSRMFTLEEVTRYSGGRNDASRMAANFAGVNISNDSRNDIVIRGNSPTGVLWRIEGMPVPNPNHFATLGTTGGPVSALNTNMLKNSDFMTSAFPAEYGNANAGVFDIQLRSGNRDKFEFTGQVAAFSGLEFMAEGPLSSEKKGSFAISYRHSFVELASAVGLNIGTTATPAYRDITFKIDLGRTKSGYWSFFGIGGTSDIDFLAEEVEPDDFFANQGEDSYATSLLGMAGVTHRLMLNDHTYIKTIIGLTTAVNTFRVDERAEDQAPNAILDIDDKNSRLTISSYVNSKLNAGFNVRAGILMERYFLDAFGRDKEDTQWTTFRDFNDNLDLYQAFGQAQWKLSDHFTVNGGLHLQYLDLNQDFALEPRAAINWHLDSKQSINLGFGMHNQMLPLPIYLFQSPTSGGAYVPSNQDTRFLKSAHYVLGYDRRFGSDWRLKTEVYYQDQIEVPVERETSSFSILNIGADFGFPQVGFLENAGDGANYGAEITIEKFFSKGYYVLSTGSFYESKYSGSDGVERNTAFNNNYVYNLLAGKEFKIGQKKTNAITLDFKWTTTGGRYYTPIDLEASMLDDKEIRLEELAFTERFDPYFRLDIKLGYRLNNGDKKISQQFYLDFQNVTNHQNVFTQRYNTSSKKIDTIYQIGFFPDILYRIQF